MKVSGRRFIHYFLLENLTRTGKSFFEVRHDLETLR